MATQDLTQIAREIVTTYTAGDWTAFKDLLTPDATYDEVGTQRKIQGADSVVSALQGWKKAMTDSGGTVSKTFASGDMVALEITWQGTQNGTFTGPTGTIPPSGKRQTTRAAMIVQFQGNKIREIHHYFDMVSFLSQIGAMPTAGART